MSDDVVQDRKTQRTGDDVAAFLANVADEQRRADMAEVVDLLREVTGAQPELWGSIIGFGRMRYTGSDTKVRETLAIGVAARKAAITLYGLTSYGSNEDLLSRLGPHTTGKGCLYVKRLDDLDQGVLREIVARGWATNHHAD